MREMPGAELIAIIEENSARFVVDKADLAFFVEAVASEVNARRGAAGVPGRLAAPVTQVKVEAPPPPPRLARRGPQSKC